MVVEEVNGNPHCVFKLVGCDAERAELAALRVARCRGTCATIAWELSRAFRARAHVSRSVTYNQQMSDVFDCDSLAVYQLGVSNHQ